MRNLTCEELDMVTGGVCQNHVTANQTGECPPGGTLNPLPPQPGDIPNPIVQNGGPFVA